MTPAEKTAARRFGSIVQATLRAVLTKQAVSTPTPQPSAQQHLLRLFRPKP